MGGEEQAGQFAAVIVEKSEVGWGVRNKRASLLQSLLRNLRLGGG